MKQKENRIDEIMKNITKDENLCIVREALTEFLKKES